MRIRILLLLLMSAPLNAEVLVNRDGVRSEGTIRGIVESTIQFKVDGDLVAYPLNNLAEIHIDENLSGDAYQAQTALKSRIEKLIDHEAVYEHHLNRQILSLLESKSYSEIEKMANDYRVENRRSPLGRSGLGVLYDAFYSDIQQRDTTAMEKRLAVVRLWRGDNPDSETAVIAEMNLLVELAWGHRGGGFANTVTEQGWEYFHRYLQEVIKLADYLMAKSAQDPSYYFPLLSALKGGGADKEEVKRLGLEVRETGLDWHITRVLGSLEPKWGGRQGEVAAALDELSYYQGEQDIDVYYRNAAAFIANTSMRDYAAFGFDYDKIALGFEQRRSQTLVNDFELHRMARISYAYDRVAEVREYGKAAPGGPRHQLLSGVGRNCDTLP